MKNSLKYFLVIMLLFVSVSNAQVVIGSSNAPHASAALDLSNTTTKGALVPRMNNAQRTAIQNPAVGLLIFNTEPNKNFLEWYNGTIWANKTLYKGNTPISDFPTPPTTITAVAGQLQATVSFSGALASATQGASFPITSYTVTSNPGNITVTTADATATSVDVTGLTAGTEYTFTVIANSLAGPSNASAASNPVTPYGFPAAPTLAFQTDPYNVGSNNISVLYVPGETTAKIYFNELTTPLETGGRPITTYTVRTTVNPANGSASFTTITATGTSSPITIENLQIGTLHQVRGYFFNVTATNSAGLESPVSVTSNQIQSRYAIPGAPTNFKAVPNGQAITFTWDAPTTGGTPHNYVIQRRGTTNGQTWTDRGGQVVGVNNTTITLTDESGFSTEHNYRVVARNASHEQNNQTNRTHSANIITFEPIPGSTTDFYDSFNEAPVTAKWELDPDTYTLFGSVANPIFFGNSKMYGQADGKWLAEKADNGDGTFTASSAQTIYTIDRTNKNVEIQFAYNPATDYSTSTWYHQFGLKSVSGVSNGVRIMWNTQNDSGVLFMNVSGDQSNMSSPIAAIGTPGVIPTTWSGDPSKVTVRIRLIKNGGMEIWANGQLNQTWTAAQLPADFNNLKFFVRAHQQTLNPNKLDDFFILSYD